MIKFIKYFIQAVFIYIMFLIGIILRLKLSKKLFAFLFCTLGPFFKSKKIIFKNLDIYSGYDSSLKKNKIIKKMWENYGMTFIEYIFLKYYRKKNNHIKIYGEKNLFDPIKNNKPVIFVSGHFSNFELCLWKLQKKTLI